MGGRRRHHERRTHRGLPVGIKGVDKVDRWRHLLDEGRQGRRSRLDLLEGFELVLDAGLGRRGGRGQVALGVGELLLVAGDQGVDMVVGLVELVLVVRIEDHPAEAGSDRQRQYQASDAENAAGEYPGSEGRGPAGALGVRFGVGIPAPPGEAPGSA